MTRRDATVVVSLIALLLVGCQGGSGNGYIARSLAHPTDEAEWRAAGVRGRKLTTEHYQVFTTTSNAALTGGIAGFLEAARVQYVDLTGLDATPVGQDKLDVYLFGSKNEWAALTQKITGAANETVQNVRAGGYCYKGVCVFWDIGTVRTYRVAAHEGLHQFLHHGMRDSLPHWAEEGLAVQAEGFRIADGLVTFDPQLNMSRLTTLRKTIIADRWRPASRLVSMTSMENLQESAMHGAEYYGQLWAMLRLIRSDPTYNEGLRRLCQDAAAGRLNETLGFPPRQWRALKRNPSAYAAVAGPKVFTHYIDADAERFERRYVAYAKQLAQLK